MTPEKTEILSRYMGYHPKCHFSGKCKGVFPTECKPCDYYDDLVVDTFTTADDMMAVKDKLSEKGDSDIFQMYAMEIYVDIDMAISPSFWLFSTPTHFLNLVAEWLKSREVMK
jgi:hypothetical protein